MERLTEIIENELNHWLQVDGLTVHLNQNYGVNKTDIRVSFKLDSIRNIQYDDIQHITAKFLTQIFKSKLTEELRNENEELKDINKKINEIHNYITSEEE